MRKSIALSIFFPLSFVWNLNQFRVVCFLNSSHQFVQNTKLFFIFSLQQIRTLISTTMATNKNNNNEMKTSNNEINCTNFYAFTFAYVKWTFGCLVWILLYVCVWEREYVFVYVCMSENEIVLATENKNGNISITYWNCNTKINIIYDCLFGFGNQTNKSNRNHRINVENERTNQHTVH